MNRTAPSIAILLVATTAVCSCGIWPKAGPDYARPEPAFEIPGIYGNDGAQRSDSLLQASWWKVFGDRGLDTLVNDVIENNLDLRRATAVVSEFRSRLTQARAGRLPSINLGGQYQKRELPDFGWSGSTGVPGAGSTGSTESYNASIAASHEVDLWGRISRGHEAAGADLLQSIESRRTVMQSVVAEAVSLYLQAQALDRRIAVSNMRIATLEKSLKTVEGRYKRGLTSILELKQVQRTLAQARSDLPQREQEFVETQHRLSLLAGRYPEHESPRSHNEDYFRSLSPVPAGLPADLLESRPDIRAAEARLTGLNARYGAAVANLFPKITLTGSYGYTSDELEGLFRPDNVLWNIAAGLTQPLFNSGRLLAEKNAARARYEQGAIDYAKTVLTAFADVENALMTRRQQLLRREHIVEFLEKARVTQRIADLRYERGLVDYLTVLDATNARYNAEESLILVELSILTNRVSLHRALGGNWIDTDSDKD